MCLIIRRLFLYRLAKKKVRGSTLKLVPITMSIPQGRQVRATAHLSFDPADTTTPREEDIGRTLLGLSIAVAGAASAAHALPLRFCLTSSVTQRALGTLLQQ